MTNKIARATKTRAQKKELPLLGQFIPVMKPLYASTSELMETHGGQTYAEIKHDGYRIQIHKTKRKATLFTGRGNEYNYNCYPDVVEIVSNLPNGIFEAELVGEGSSHKQVFDNMKKRFRREGISDKSVEKYIDSGVVDQVPLSLRLFDTIRFERKNLLYAPIEKRREYTEKIDEKGIDIIEQQTVTGEDALSDLIKQTFDAREEGLVCKKPGSLYRPGKAHNDWVKFKRSETLDLVVVGLYANRDTSSEMPYTTALCATYNDSESRYETIGKVGLSRNGRGREVMNEISEKLSERRPSNVKFSEKLDTEANNRHVPDVYVNPEQSIVLEIKAMNINYANNWQSCGDSDGKAYSLRIGFVEELRHDKSPKMATKTSAVAKLYELQEGGAVK